MLTSDEDRTPGGHPVVVLAYDYWQSRFNADPKIVGQKILINNFPMTICGCKRGRVCWTIAGRTAEGPIAVSDAEGDGGLGRRGFARRLFASG